MRIMQLMLSTQNGGAETFFEKLVLALADAGVRQCVVIEPNARREALFAAHPNLEVKTLRFRGVHEIFGRVRLHLLLRRWRPQLLMAWMSRAIKRAPTGYCPIVARLGGYYRVDRFRKSDRLIGNTPDIVRYLQQQGVPAQKTQCIANFGEIAPCALNREQARQQLRQELNIPPQHKVLLALGRLHKAKAHDTLLDALAKTRDCTLLIAGDGALRDDLEQQITRLQLSERVHLLGWRRDTGYLFQAADLCVFPSREEPFGNVVVEAWAQHTPLIAAAAAGPAWLISPERDALLVAVDDSKALAAAIERLRSDDELCRQLVDNGYQTYRQHYSREAITAQYLQMFEEVIAGRPASTQNLS